MTKPNSEVRITVSLPGDAVRELRLEYPLNPEHGELLWEIHDHHGGRRVLECRMHDHDPLLADLRDADGRVRGIWMTLRAIDDVSNPGCKRLVLCHWPNSPAGPGSHDVPRPMSVEHILGQEYVAERGQDFGHDVVVNRAFSTENLCRADVRVTGSDATLSAEIQVTPVETANVLRRTREARRAGAESAWFPRMEGVPDWAFKVPTVSTNEVASTRPRTWTVTSGLRALEDERCTPTSRFVVCPVLGRGHCGMFHPLWVPMVLVSGRKVAVDDVVERFPDGGLVRFDTGGRQGVVLTTPSDRDRWLAFDAERRVSGRPSRSGMTGRVGRLRHSPYPSSELRERLAREGRRPSPSEPAAGRPEIEPVDDGWCSVWCRHPGSHWRRDGDGWMWRPDLVGCAHPGHDDVPVWGIAAVDLSDPVVRGLSGARGWFWCVLRGGRMARWGWSDTARWAADAALWSSVGYEHGAPRRDVPVVRCGRVAAEGWRVLAYGESVVVPDAA